MTYDNHLIHERLLQVELAEVLNERPSQAELDRDDLWNKRNGKRRRRRKLKCKSSAPLKFAERFRSGRLKRR
ncbi:MAG: hypothetical protein KGJ13_08420 [Patescibacteria group bacterium]|nr:hypothetical protein [Patescibacteria group bacterium]